MMQAKLEAISIMVSKLVGDEVSSAYTDGKTFTAADRIDAINRARAIVYVQALNTMGIDQLTDAFPEFVRRGYKVIAPVKSEDIRKVFKVFKNSVKEGMPVQQYYDSLYNPDSKFKVDVSNPRFVEYGTVVKLIPEIPE